MRVRTIALLLGLVMAGLALVPPVAAQDDDDHEGDTPTTSATLPDGVGIGDEIFLTGAVITPPDGAAPRTLDAYHAAVFVQSWLATAYFGGKEIVRDPPPDLPVYRVDITGSWVGTVGIQTVHYTDDGSTPYVAFPGLGPSPTMPDPPPEPSGWFAAFPRVIDAFNGEAELIETTGTQQAAAQQAAATSTTTSTTSDTTEEAASPGGGSDPSVVWIAAALAGAAVLVGGGLWFRRRRA